MPSFPLSTILRFLRHTPKISPTNLLRAIVGRRCVGIIWMTATMRRNFELFWVYLSLDMMKCGLNTLLWPYVAVFMYDKNKKLCIAYDGILCREQVDMYKFVADFLAESATGCLFWSILWVVTASLIRRWLWSLTLSMNFHHGSFSSPPFVQSRPCQKLWQGWSWTTQWSLD